MVIICTHIPSVNAPFTPTSFHQWVLLFNQMMLFKWTHPFATYATSSHSPQPRVTSFEPCLHRASNHSVTQHTIPMKPFSIILTSFCHMFWLFWVHNLWCFGCSSVLQTTANIQSYPGLWTCWQPIADI